MDVATGFLRFPHWRGAKIMAFVACGVLLQGCSNGFPQLGGPRPNPVAPGTAPVSEPTAGPAVRPKARTASKPPPVMTRKPPQASTRDMIDLNVLYYERILVPPGSALSIRAEAANAATPSLKKTTTEGGMPYQVSIPVSPRTDAYPMTIEATLTSTIGHVLAGSVTLTKPPTAPVELLIRTKSNSDSQPQ